MSKIAVILFSLTTALAAHAEGGPAMCERYLTNLSRQLNYSNETAPHRLLNEMTGKHYTYTGSQFLVDEGDYSIFRLEFKAGKSPAIVFIAVQTSNGKIVEMFGTIPGRTLHRWDKNIANGRRYITTYLQNLHKL